MYRGWGILPGAGIFKIKETIKNNADFVYITINGVLFILYFVQVSRLSSF